MSKPTVSRYVGDLEQRLGFGCFSAPPASCHSQKRDAPFMADASGLADVEVAEAEITSQSVAVKGLIKVNAPMSFGILELAPLLARFHVQVPDIELDITLADRVVDLLKKAMT